MSILKKYILSVFIFAATFGAKAFPVLIKGHAPVGVALSLRAGFMNEDIALKIDASGYFNYSADLKYPSQFNLFIGNSEDLTYQFFIFSSSEIVINIPGPTTEGITATGLSERSAAFAKIEDLVYVDLFTVLQSSNNKDSILNIVEKTILDISGIGGDNYTTVTATCAKIVLMNTLFTTDYKPLYNIYETS
ncbi:MAG: hypothetical protein H7321_00090 [Bacteroidia bacterium]|nr:hypothetical protein [Bacteroidia bacterium]